jgi:hypothetical protein
VFPSPKSPSAIFKDHLLMDLLQIPWSVQEIISSWSKIGSDVFTVVSTWSCCVHLLSCSIDLCSLSWDMVILLDKENGRRWGGGDLPCHSHRTSVN